MASGNLKMTVRVDVRPAVTELGRVKYSVVHLGHKGRDVRCWMAGRLWSLAHQVGRLADGIDPVDRHTT